MEQMPAAVAAMWLVHPGSSGLRRSLPSHTRPPPSRRRPLPAAAGQRWRAAPPPPQPRGRAPAWSPTASITQLPPSRPVRPADGPAAAARRRPRPPSTAVVLSGRRRSASPGRPAPRPVRPAGDPIGGRPNPDDTLKNRASFFKRNSPEPDQARESFLLKNHGPKVRPPVTHIFQVLGP